MAFGAIIRQDSVTQDGDNRLTTFEITHPRYVLAEVNTHRMLSKNSASSRAIPVATMLKRLKADPYTPCYWGSNKKGMQAGEELDKATQQLCLDEWLAARDEMMARAGKLRELGLHKQDANRLLEPFMWHTALISGTEWSNFFHLRNHPDAHPAFQTVAAMMQELHDNLEPAVVQDGQWHLPLIGDDSELTEGEDMSALAGDDEAWKNFVKISTGRCARISHLTHDGVRDPKQDSALHDRLGGSGHMSPYEHQARPATEEDFNLAMVKTVDINIGYSIGVPGHTTPRLSAQPKDMWFGNFRGWVQYRKTIPGESDMLAHLQDQA